MSELVWSVLWWSASHAAHRVLCDGLDEAASVAQHTPARGPGFKARVETKRKGRGGKWNPASGVYR